jgi:hypothetical protein
MAKYVAQHQGQPVSSVFLHDQEYKAKDGFIVIPDGHEAAHHAARRVGLTKAE